MSFSFQWKRRLVIVFALAASLVALLSAGQVVADDPQTPPAGLRVFYTGHSFHMFVPSRVEQFVKAAGIKGHRLVGTQGIGGSRVIQHWDLVADKNKAKQALTSGEVDVFTMAPHVLIPDEGITNFTKLGLQHNPHLRLIVQVSWYPFDVPDPTKRIRDNAQRDGMRIDELQAAIDQWRTKVEAQIDVLNAKHDRRVVFLVPAGDAVVKLRAMVVGGDYPGVTRQSELFRDPIGHGGPHIQALVAYCNYVAIYRTSPVGLDVPAQGLTAKQNAILQELAWETVSKYPYAGVGAKQDER